MENLTFRDLKRIAVSLEIEPLSIRRKKLEALIEAAKEEKDMLPSRNELKSYCREHRRTLGFSVTGKGRNKKYMLEKLAKHNANTSTVLDKSVLSPILRVISHWSWPMVIETLELLGYTLDGEVGYEDGPSEDVCELVREVLLTPTQKSVSALFGKGRTFSQGFWRAYMEEVFPRYYGAFKGLKVTPALNTYYREFVPQFNNGKWKVSGVWDFLFMECISIEQGDCLKASATFFSISECSPVTPKDLAYLVDVGPLAVLALAERHPEVRTILIHADYSQYAFLTYDLAERQKAWSDLALHLISPRYREDACRLLSEDLNNPWLQDSWRNVNYPSAMQPFNKPEGLVFSNMGHVLLDDDAVKKDHLEIFMEHACVSGHLDILEKAYALHQTFMSRLSEKAHSVFSSLENELPRRVRSPSGQDSRKSYASRRLMPLLSRLSVNSVRVGNVDVLRAITGKWTEANMKNRHEVLEACIFHDIPLTEHIVSIFPSQEVAKHFEKVCRLSRFISAPASLLEPRVRTLGEIAHYLHRKGVLDTEMLDTSQKHLHSCTPVTYTKTPVPTTLLIVCNQCGERKRCKYTKLRLHEMCKRCGIVIDLIAGCNEYNRSQRYVNRNLEAYYYTYGYESESDYDSWDDYDDGW